MLNRPSLLLPEKAAYQHDCGSRHPTKRKLQATINTTAAAMRRPRTVAGRFGDRGAHSGTRGAHRATARPLVGREPATARGGAQHRGRGSGPDPGSGGTAGTTGGRIAATRRSRPATLHAQRARRPPPGARTDAPVGRPPPARQGRRFLLPPVF